MCGIYGVSYGPGGAAAEPWTPEEFMAAMFPAIVHRGPHAYGWMAWDGENVTVEKYPGRADTAEAAAQFHIDTTPRWLVGHVRFATHGSPDYGGNNHPLVHGNVVGVHNGVLHNHNQILGRFGRQDPKAEVDSEAIFAAVNRLGHREGLRIVQGDLAVVYTHMDKPDTLHMARSHGRPLVWTYTPAGSMVFASEERVIDATGIEHGPYYHLGRYRLIRVREGRIRSRITYQVEPARTEYTSGYVRPMSVGRVRPTAPRSWTPTDPIDQQLTGHSDRVQRMFDSITRDAERAERSATLARQREEAENYNKLPVANRNLQDGDEWQGLFYYKGKLRAHDDYLDLLIEDVGFGDDGWS